MIEHLDTHGLCAGRASTALGRRIARLCCDGEETTGSCALPSVIQLKAVAA